MESPSLGWKNTIPKSTLLVVKVKGIIADLGLIEEYFTCGAYAMDDIEGLLERLDNMAAATNEMRMGVEISAEARAVSDDEYDESYGIDDVDE